jgi:hypothetical protein
VIRYDDSRVTCDVLFPVPDVRSTLGFVLAERAALLLLLSVFWAAIIYVALTTAL